MPHVLLPTLPEIGKCREIFRGKKPHDEQSCGSPVNRMPIYVKPSVAMVGSSIAEVIANPWSA